MIRAPLFGVFLSILICNNWVLFSRSVATEKCWNFNGEHAETLWSQKGYFMKNKAIKFRCENNFLFQTSKSTAQLEQFD